MRSSRSTTASNGGGGGGTGGGGGGVNGGVGGGGGGGVAGGVSVGNGGAKNGPYDRTQEYNESAMFDMSEDEAEDEVEAEPGLNGSSHRRISDILRPQQQRTFAGHDSPRSSVAASPSRLPQQQLRAQPRMRASWLTDSFVLSRRQSIADSIGRPSIARARSNSSTSSSSSGSSDGRHTDYDAAYEGRAPLVEIFQRGERLGPGLLHDGHPIHIAHTSQGFRAQDDDDSGSQLEIVRKLGEGSYAVVYLVREIVPAPSPAPGSVQQSPSQGLDDLDQYSRTLRASEQPHTNPDSPWSSPHPPLRSSPAARPTGRKFALKCLCKRHLDDVHLEIQRLEATIHQSIGFHPNIVTLYRVYETPDWLFLVLEYCPGQDLYFWLERSQDLAGGLTPAGSVYHGNLGSALSSPSRALSPRPLPSLHSNEPWDLDEDFENTPPNPSLLGSTSNLSLLSRRRLRLVSRMFRQMCDSVQFCHDKGISHRDLKPENFIVEDRRWFFDWEEEEDAYENDETSQYGANRADDKDRADKRPSVNLLAATPTAASILDQSRQFRGSDPPNRPSPSRSVASFNRGGTGSREGGKVVVKLTDFGLATADEQCRDFDCGSKPYMAFECANDNAPYYDAKQADIWSLGVCLLNLIFHRSPFSEPNAERCESFASFCYDPVKFLTEAFEGLTRDAAEFLSKNVFCEISDRYPGRTRISARAFADWAEHLPEHMGLASTDASRTLTRGPDHSITSPLSHSRAGSVASYLPFSIDGLSMHETVPVDPLLPEHLQHVELPEELGDSTYIQPGDTTSSISRDEGSWNSSRTASDADATLGAALGAGGRHSESSLDHANNSSDTHGSAEERERPSLDEHGDGDGDGEGEGDGEATGDSEQKAQSGKPRRRKRGARKGRNAVKPIDTAELVTGPTAAQQQPVSDLDRAINQLAAASQQLARDVSKMKNGAPSALALDSSSSGQPTAVPPTPHGSRLKAGGALMLATNSLNTLHQNGNAHRQQAYGADSLSHGIGQLPPPPLSVVTDGRFNGLNKASVRAQHGPSSPLQQEHEPMEVMMQHTSSADRIQQQQQQQPWRPLNPGLTKPTSWRDRNTGPYSSSTSSSNSTFGVASSDSTASSMHSTASAPAGLPGPRHRPADLKQAGGDAKAVDVSYLAAVFNGVKKKMGGSQVLGGNAGRKGGGHAGGGGGVSDPQTHLGRPTAQTASAPARHVQMPSSLLHSVVGGSPAPTPSPSPMSVPVRVSSGVSISSGTNANGHMNNTNSSKNGNGLAGARPQWRDQQTGPGPQPQPQPQQAAQMQPVPDSAHQQYHLHQNYHQQNHHRNGPDGVHHPPPLVQQQQQQQQLQKTGGLMSAWAAPVLPMGVHHESGAALSAITGYHYQHHHAPVRNDHHHHQQQLLQHRGGGGGGVPGGGSAPGSLNADAAKTWRRN